MSRSILIGIAGGSGSGKTLVAKNLLKDFGSDEVLIIMQDDYYKDLSHLPMEERVKNNFDHPDAIDNDLLAENLKNLLAGQSIEQPIYDFKSHCRKTETRRIEPSHILILDGILVLDSRLLWELMDIKIFVDTDADIRFIRRLRRDLVERGRTLESVVQQYIETVRPMHLEFVEPSKRHADIIIPEGGHNLVAIDLIKTKIKALLREKVKKS